MQALIDNKEIELVKGKKAFLFLIAILVLVFSCPFKRLLQAENNIQAFAQQSLRWNKTVTQDKTNKGTTCCSQKSKTTLVSQDHFMQQVPGPDVLYIQNIHTGFGIHYFLSGTESIYKPFTSNPVSSLPLFLQHRRLLI